MGFIQSVHDDCLFTRDVNGTFTTLLIYVDDVIITSASISTVDQVKKSLHFKFTIKDLGYLKYFFGLKVAKYSSSTIISQRKFVLDLLHDTGMLHAKSFSHSFVQRFKS